MNEKARQKKEFGDYQTPDHLASMVCQKLKKLNISADIIIEPTCGKGSFIIAAHDVYSNANIIGYEINPDYIEIINERISNLKTHSIEINLADFFTTDWSKITESFTKKLLVLGNLPWVTNSTQGSLQSTNIPQKNNFLNFKGFDAITGKSNFDISEWMLIECLSWFQNREGTLAMLVKTAVARKTIAHAKKTNAPLTNSSIYKIDAKTFFNASVEACLLILEFSPNTIKNYDYNVYDSLESNTPTIIGHRNGLTISNLSDYNNYKYLLGPNPLKWRSGVKHDRSAVMELTRQDEIYINGLGEIVDIEPDLLFPLMKGSDIGSNKEWREKFVIITQQKVGADTAPIKLAYPKTWDYLISHADKLDSRKSIIYKNNPRFSIFGIGDYSFKPWKIAICSLYKSLSFRLISPIENKPVQFDDTVYFIAFDSQIDAQHALTYLQSDEIQKILNSLIFWDDKRPIKTSILNLLNWEKSNSINDPDNTAKQFSFTL